MTFNDGDDDIDDDLPEGSTAAHRIRATLMQRITEGDIAPGTRLNENSIAKEFGVSRGPVREALRSLVESRLLTVVHNKGVWVRSLKIDEALHLFDIRIGLANITAKLLTKRISRSQIETLYEFHRAMEEAKEEEDPRKFYRINDEFHVSILKFAGNPRLETVWLNFDRELKLYLRQVEAVPSQLRLSNAQHLKMIEKVAEGDVEGAAAEFEKHVETGKERFLDRYIAVKR